MSRTVTNIVHQLVNDIKEDNQSMDSVPGKFELHYTPANTQNKSYIVTLLKQTLPVGHGGEQINTELAAAVIPENHRKISTNAAHDVNEIVI